MAGIIRAWISNSRRCFGKCRRGYIGFVEELPGANTQGATLEEPRANLQEAVEMVLQANRELIEEASAGGEVSCCEKVATIYS